MLFSTFLKGGAKKITTFRKSEIFGSILLKTIFGSTFFKGGNLKVEK